MLCQKIHLATGGLRSGQEYDLDFDHQFIQTEKYDAKRTYKKFFGYSPGVAVIGDNIVGIENRDGNANVRFCQQHTLERIFTRLENNGIRINRARMDCGSCYFYIRANRCSAFYEDMFILRGWRTEEINGFEFELSNGKKITSYSFKIFFFLSLAIFYPSLVLLGSASSVV